MHKCIESIIPGSIKSNKEMQLFQKTYLILDGLEFRGGVKNETTLSPPLLYNAYTTACNPTQRVQLLTLTLLSIASINHITQ